jgi:two-component system phosphate regulon sensor histidine kinase PhoR
MAMSFRTKLLASHVGLVAAVGLIAIFTLNRWLTEDLVRQLDTRLLEQAKGAVEWAEEGGRRHPDKVATRIAHIVDAEVALLDRDGAVIGASPPDARSDLGDEIGGARSRGVGKATRMRGRQEMHYVAVPGADGIVVRLGIPLSEVNETVAAMRSRLLVTSGVAIVVALVLGLLASRVTSQLAAERDHLSAILAGMVEGVLVIDRRGRVIVANPAVNRIVDTRSSVVGSSLEDVVTHPEAHALIEACMRGEVTETELEITDERGRFIAVYVRPLPASAGGAVVAVLRDQTALRRLMTIRRDFVANVSHELRTPVTAIQGYAETLLRGKTDQDTSKQFLEIVHRQAQRLGGLVEQLLALSELEARGREDIAREKVKLVSVAQHVAETVRGRAETRKVRVAIDVPKDVIALADPEGVERAVINLVDNAIKYGSEGGEVKVTGVRDGATVKLIVSDDGPGIDPAHLPRLFERFYRVDPGRSRQQGGAGLGLSIVKHLVEAMDGSIEVTSELGKGARFVITLPAPPTAPASASAAAAVTG